MLSASLFWTLQLRGRIRPVSPRFPQPVSTSTDNRVGPSWSLSTAWMLSTTRSTELESPFRRTRYRNLKFSRVATVLSMEGLPSLSSMLFQNKAVTNLKETFSPYFGVGEFLPQMPLPANGTRATPTHRPGL